MNTDSGLEQSRELAENMDHWLDFIDRDLSDQEVPLSLRPLQALMMLFREGAIEVNMGDERIDDPKNLGKSVEKLWFRVLFDAVEYWYVERYGAPAMKSGGNASLKGAQMIREVPFAISVPANRNVLEEEGELAWMYFEDGLGEGEDPTAWIVDGPDLSNLENEARETADAEAKRTAEILRAIEFRRVTFPSDGDHEVHKPIQSTLTYLSQAAHRMVSGQRPEIGPAWFDLQMANEAALKAVIRNDTGKQPHIHPLDDLLRRAQQHGVVFESFRISGWPRLSDISYWRYGQGSPLGVARLYSAYQMSLELVSACMSQIKPGMGSGFGVLIRYTPWRTKSALGEYRE
ncbi:hypothetical protein [Rhodovulum sulfidophilum]|uniref:Uncharacterized protein n=1 Tax=Rhodovulum sulfidophilum TaxID=35806 RepID=A0ABS1RVP7_RHOSU|nr:hypothetical protein [Rhodovulum sulfidophilum]MBL3609577.1 hypothetical protein [Rhodovulum sulfidophilum]MCE8456238.1 hypothetical protein [Rhodovulum sulfidophilum]